jgi:outer membrane lipoprotein carrier protein
MSMIKGCRILPVVDLTLSRLPISLGGWALFIGVFLSLCGAVTIAQTDEHAQREASVSPANSAAGHMVVNNHNNDEKKADRATQALMDVLAKMARFQADFAQFTQDSEGVILQEVRGRVHLARPQRFHWDIRSPYRQTLVVRDEKLWIVDDDLEQVTVQSLSAQVGLTPAVLLSGNPAEMQQHYSVSRDELPGGAQKFILRPRAEAGLFEQLNVVVEAGQLKEMDFRDTLGQRTAINFMQVHVNQAFDEAIFTVSVPEGYDYIEDM